MFVKFVGGPVDGEIKELTTEMLDLPIGCNGRHKDGSLRRYWYELDKEKGICTLVNDDDKSEG